MIVLAILCNAWSLRTGLLPDAYKVVTIPVNVGAITYSTVAEVGAANAIVMHRPFFFISERPAVLQQIQRHCMKRMLVLLARVLSTGCDPFRRPSNQSQRRNG